MQAYCVKCRAKKEMKDAATQIMEKYGWGHKECVGAPTKIEIWE